MSMCVQGHEPHKWTVKDNFRQLLLFYLSRFQEQNPVISLAQQVLLSQSQLVAMGFCFCFGFLFVLILSPSVYPWLA